jgi:hypothetical protein
MKRVSVVALLVVAGLLASFTSSIAEYVLLWSTDVERLINTHNCDGGFADLDGDGRIEVVTVQATGPNFVRVRDDLSGAIEFEAPLSSAVPDCSIPLQLDMDSLPEIVLFSSSPGSTGCLVIDFLGSSTDVMPQSVVGSATDTAIRPNPFNPSAMIDYSIPQKGTASLAVYDASGRLVRTLFEGKVEAGKQSATWDGRDNAGQTLPSGTYFYSLTVNGQTLDTGKAVMLK